MKGTIKAYSTSVNAGVISGADGNSYRFDLIDWLRIELPQNNETVTFDGYCRHASKIMIAA